MRIGLREMARHNGFVASMLDLQRAAGGGQLSQGTRRLVERMHRAGYLRFGQQPSEALRHLGVSCTLTTFGWRAYRHHWWRDRAFMDVGLPEDMLDRACAWQHNEPASTVEPDPVTLRKLLRDNDLGSSGV
jgi:hypothetical protein